MPKNPFPGMNPYFERHWGDVHASLVLYARNQLNRQLTGSLRARVEERLVVEDVESGDSRAIVPDVKVYQPRTSKHEPFRTSSSGVAVAEPHVVFLADSEPETTTYLRIIDAASGGSLVSVVEFLSPANKRPKSAASSRQYLAKRKELAANGVSLVEIDLIREGERFFPDYDERYDVMLRTAYAACVHRGWEKSRYELYAFGLREKLPAIAIPLREMDDDAILDLQALVDQVFEDGRYDDIDYARPLDPPLSADDAAWASSLVGTQ